MASVQQKGNGWYFCFLYYGKRHTFAVGPVSEQEAEAKQTMLPPSLHPSGSVYEWITPLTLSNASPADLPEIPTSSMALINSLFKPESVRAQSTTPKHDPHRETDAADIAEALQFIPSDDCDWWIRMGMALRQQNLRQSLRPKLEYLNKLRKRMEHNQFPTRDRLYLDTLLAQQTLHELVMEIETLLSYRGTPEAFR